MIRLSDIRDYIDSLHLSEYVYMGKLDSKQEKSIGVYHSKHEPAYKTALGGWERESYGIKYVTFLVHWNHSPRDTEKAANSLFEAVRKTEEVKINQTHIKFIQPLTNSPVDIGTDDSGVYEMVLEVAVIHDNRFVGEASKPIVYQKGEKKDADRSISSI